MDVKTVRESRGTDPVERKPRTTMQLPVYREASRLAYVLFRVFGTYTVVQNQTAYQVPVYGRLV